MKSKRPSARASRSSTCRAAQSGDRPRTARSPASSARRWNWANPTPRAGANPYPFRRRRLSSCRWTWSSRPSARKRPEVYRLRPAASSFPAGAPSKPMTYTLETSRPGVFAGRRCGHRPLDRHRGGGRRHRRRQLHRPVSEGQDIEGRPGGRNRPTRRNWNRSPKTRKARPGKHMAGVGRRNGPQAVSRRSTWASPRIRPNGRRPAASTAGCAPNVCSA